MSVANPGIADEVHGSPLFVPFGPTFSQNEEEFGRGTLDTRGITLWSAAGELHVGGRLQYDFGAADLIPRQDFGALSANGSVRRAWIETALTLPSGTLLAFQYNFAPDTQPIKDAYLSQRFGGNAHVVLGNMKEPFSLNRLDDDTTLLFTERSLLDTFAPDRSFGLGAGGNGERWTLFGGVFGGEPPDTGIGGFGIAGAARFTDAPILDGSQVLHLGASASYRALDRGAAPPSFSDKPEDYLFSTALVSTGAVKHADAIGRLGLEAAYAYGPVRVQSEYAAVTVARAASGDRVFQAGYVEAGWVLNGQGRAYRLGAPAGPEYAIFEGVKVEDSQRVSRGGTGVFEIGARISTIDLRAGKIEGGFERDATFGLNWYPDTNVRLMADYVRAHADPAASSAGGRPIDSDIFIGRAQVFW